MHTLHEQDYAFDDNLLNNYMIDDDGAIWSIDHEYATTDAHPNDKSLDFLTLISDARHLPAEQYAAVRDGVTDGYGQSIPTAADIGAGASSPVVAKFMEHNTDWARNAVCNIFTDLAYRGSGQ
jgi:tRNA A-37 threonylcarbamoyl transferase component Bud32